MVKEELLGILKTAMRGEMDGIMLYENAAHNAENKDVIDFFTHRAIEEKQHYDYLMSYYQDISNNNPDLEDFSEKIRQEAPFHPIITPDFLKRIGEHQVLFSAISTAILLEKHALDYYKECAEKMDNLTLKSFYTVLSQWEGTHYDDLLAIAREAEEYWWDQNRFAPF